jgi:hypothetical protein
VRAEDQATAEVLRTRAVRPRADELLRRFKDEMRAEIGRSHRSKYYIRTSKSGYAEMTDFDTERMTKEYSAAYPELRSEDVSGFITFAVYLYHMR